MQVLLSAMLIDALHAPLEDREIALNRVGMDRAVVTVDIFALAVTGEVMSREVLAKVLVLARFVRHDAGLFREPAPRIRTVA